MNTRMPSGSDVTQRTDKQPAFSAHLLEPILQPSNILQPWKRVRANKGAAGIDGVTIDDFPAWAKAGNRKRIMTELRSGQYRPAPVRRVEIDKPDGGKRQLGIPIIADRVIQQAIAQVLIPIFDPAFSNNSFGFRPHRNGQQAVKQVKDIIKTRRHYAVDVDLSKFFDRVDHDLLMTAPWGVPISLLHRMWPSITPAVNLLVMSFNTLSAQILCRIERSKHACSILSKNPFRSASSTQLTFLKLTIMYTASNT
nr:reverse transcriptase domain-containing protein [Paraglaciecola sp. MB-3u-78]